MAVILRKTRSYIWRRQCGVNLRRRYSANNSIRKHRNYNSRRHRGELKTNALFAVIKKNKDLKAIIEKADTRHTNEVDYFHNTCLHYAVRRYLGDLTNIELLLKFNADANRQNLKGETPLHFAVRNPNCNADLIRALLDSNGNPNIQNQKMESPLHIIIKAHSHNLDANIDVIKLLLERGANPNIRDHRGITPMTAAFGRSVVEKNVNWNIIIELIEHGGDADYVYDERSILNLAITKRIDPDIIKRIIHCKPHLVQQKTVFNTPLHHLVNTYSSMDVLEALLHHGADVNAKNGIWDTPLHMPIYSTNPSIISTLIRYGADVKAVNMKGDTPLLSTIQQEDCNPNIIAILLEYGSDVNAENYSKKTAMFYAKKKPKEYESLEIVKLLLDYGANPNTMNLGKKKIFDCCHYKLAKYVIPFLVLWNFRRKSDLKKPERVINFKRYSSHKSKFKCFSTLRNSCMSTLIKMKEDKISKKYTLYQYVFDNCTMSKSSVEYPCEFVREILIRENKKKYRNCKDLLMTSLKRKKLANYLSLLRICCRHKRRTVVLDPASTKYLSKFLDKSSLINLIKAYS